jgi:hypothetical protein
MPIFVLWFNCFKVTKEGNERKKNNTKEGFLARIHKVYFLTAQISGFPVLVLFVKVIFRE